MATIHWRDNFIFLKMGDREQELGYLEKEGDAGPYVMWLKDHDGIIMGSLGAYIRGDEWPTEEEAKEKAMDSASVRLMHLALMRQMALRSGEPLDILNDRVSEQYSIGYHVQQKDPPGIRWNLASFACPSGLENEMYFDINSEISPPRQGQKSQILEYQGFSWSLVRKRKDENTYRNTMFFESKRKFDSVEACIEDIKWVMGAFAELATKAKISIWHSYYVARIDQVDIKWKDCSVSLDTCRGYFRDALRRLDEPCAHLQKTQSKK